MEIFHVHGTLYKVTKISDKKIVEPYCKWQRMYTDHCLNPECNYVITWTNIWIITLLTDHWCYYLLNFQVDAPQSQVVGSVLTSQVGIFLKIIFTVMIFMQHSKMFYFFLVLIHKGLLKNHTKGEKNHENKFKCVLWCTKRLVIPISHWAGEELPNVKFVLLWFLFRLAFAIMIVTSDALVVYYLISLIYHLLQHCPSSYNWL